jgi:hypothetical protein
MMTRRIEGVVLTGLGFTSSLIVTLLSSDSLQRLTKADSQPDTISRFCIAQSRLFLKGVTCIMKLTQAPGGAQPLLGDLSEVTGEVVFFDDEKAISVGLNQPKVVEALHKDADPRPGRAHHLGQFFMGNL